MLQGLILVVGRNDLFFRKSFSAVTIRRMYIADRKVKVKHMKNIQPRYYVYGVLLEYASSRGCPEILIIALL